MLAAQGSLAPRPPGIVPSAVLGDHDKVLVRGARGLGDQRGMAAVPSGAGWGGTTEGGQESHICTPERVLQLPSRRSQALLAAAVVTRPVRDMAAILLLPLVTPTHA